MYYPHFAYMGEAWVRDVLLPWPTYEPPNANSPYDLRYGPLLIEVKTARPYRCKHSYKTRWQFNVSKHLPPHGLTVLVCATSNGFQPFLVPNWFLTTKQHVQITSQPWKYSGWLARFLWRMDSIDECYYQSMRYLSQDKQLCFAYLDA